MFTLIAMGTAWLTCPALWRQFLSGFPAPFRSMMAVPMLVFEAAAAIVTLVFAGTSSRTARA